MPVIILVPIAASALFLLVRWHARTYAYRCRNCSDEFEISTLRDLVSPHGLGLGGGWQLLRCPRCGRWTRASVIRKREMGRR
jgi:DNA-directed RNA polymerase subunit RPC12/RpoP